MTNINDRDFNTGGVLEPGWFNIVVTFLSRADAKAAEQKFRDAGYAVERLDEIDPHSDETVWLTVSKAAGTARLAELAKQARELADELGGWADEHWIA